MYLSRIRLNTQSREVMRALASPTRFHGGVETACSGERKRRLWRLDSLDGQLYLLLLSEVQPSLSDFAKQFGFSGEFETKDYTPLLRRIENGGVWRFRLTANPTIAKSRPDERGKILAHTSNAFQNEWLIKKSAQNGFSVNPDEFLVTQSKWYQFRKGNSSARISVLAVTYEGLLTVTDAERFREALCGGIGREKAYGMGMLTVVMA